jgi:hypothetical protein
MNSANHSTGVIRVHAGLILTRMNQSVEATQN